MSFQRIVSKGPPEYMYISSSLEFENGHNIELTVAEMKQFIMETVRVMFGEVGKAIPVDILKYNENTKHFMLRVPHSGFVKVWSSLTICAQYKDMECAFRVHQVSGHLMALSVNSRTKDIT